MMEIAGPPGIEELGSMLALLGLPVAPVLVKVVIPTAGLFLPMFGAFL